MFRVVSTIWNVNDSQNWFFVLCGSLTPTITWTFKAITTTAESQSTPQTHCAAHTISHRPSPPKLSAIKKIRGTEETWNDFVVGLFCMWLIKWMWCECVYDGIYDLNDIIILFSHNVCCNAWTFCSDSSISLSIWKLVYGNAEQFKWFVVVWMWHSLLTTHRRNHLHPYTHLAPLSCYAKVKTTTILRARSSSVLLGLFLLCACSFPFWYASLYFIRPLFEVYIEYSKHTSIKLVIWKPRDKTTKKYFAFALVQH